MYVRVMELLSAFKRLCYSGNWWSVTTMIPHKESCFGAILKSTYINRNTSGKTEMKRIIGLKKYEMRSKH